MGHDHKHGDDCSHDHDHKNEHKHEHGEDCDHDHEPIDIEQAIEEAIKELPVAQKIRAVAINTYLKEKKALDEELEKKIAEINHEFELKSLPLYAAVSKKEERDEYISNIDD